MGEVALSDNQIAFWRLLPFGWTSILLYPPPPGLLESTRYVAKEAKIFEFKGLTGKILKTKELGLTRSISGTVPYKHGVADGFLSQRLNEEFALLVPK